MPFEQTINYALNVKYFYYYANHIKQQLLIPTLFTCCTDDKQKRLQVQQLQELIMTNRNLILIIMAKL